MIVKLSLLNQKTRKMRRGEKNQSDKIDLEIHKDIPVPIIIDYSLLFKQYFYCAFLKSKYTSTEKIQ